MLICAISAKSFVRPRITRPILGPIRQIHACQARCISTRFSRSTSPKSTFSLPVAAFWSATNAKKDSWKDTFTIDLSDALQEAFEPKKPLFLDMYTATDIADMLEMLGVTSALAKKGFNDLVVLITPREEGDFVDRATITDKSLLSPEDLAKLESRLAQGKPITANHVNVTDKSFLIDLMMRSRPSYMPHDSLAYQQLNRLEEGDWLHLLGDKGNPTTCTVALANGMLSPTDATRIKLYMNTKIPELNLLQVDWVALQNPRLAFSESRIQLPGQKHPGLHAAKQIHTCFQLLASKNGRDGVMDVPEYFHNAYMYQQAGYRFLNPAFQGWFEACLSDLAGDIASKGLGAVAWAWTQGCVHDPELGNRTVLWFPQEQIFPTSERMYNYFGLEPVDKANDATTASVVYDHETHRDPNSRYTEIKNEYRRLYRGHFEISWTQPSLSRFASRDEKCDQFLHDFGAFPLRQPISVA